MKTNPKTPLERLRADSKATMAALIEESLRSRFLIGSHNSIKLKKSLATAGRLDLEGRTLLTPTVHKEHARRLYDRYQSRWDKIKDKAQSNWSILPKATRQGTVKATDHEIAANHIRFLTLIGCVTVVASGEAVRAAVKLKEKLITTAQATRGITCLGAIEVEVVSMALMRELGQLDKPTASEQRKFDVCERLADCLKGTLYAEDQSLFLIHFHGLVTAKDPKQFEIFNDKLKRVKNWSLAPRQIELKKLSTQFGGKPKSVDQSLHHIATYITKGGNDWMAGKAYLRYKIGFEADDELVNDETSWVAKNWRKNKLLQREHAEEGITDALSLTVNEIAQLAVVIDQLMGLNSKRTGYLVSVGR